MSHITLSEKHGVNPSLLECPVCGEAMGIALLGRLPADAEAPRRMVASLDPCDKCKSKLFNEGYILAYRASIQGGKPVPTGQSIMLRDEFFKRVFEAMEIPAKRIVFLEDTTFDSLVTAATESASQNDQEETGE